MFVLFVAIFEWHILENILQYWGRKCIANLWWTILDLLFFASMASGKTQGKAGSTLLAHGVCVLSVLCPGCQLSSGFIAHWDLKCLFPASACGLLNFKCTSRCLCCRFDFFLFFKKYLNQFYSTAALFIVCSLVVQEHILFKGMLYMHSNPWTVVCWMLHVSRCIFFMS